MLLRARWQVRCLAVFSAHLEPCRARGHLFSLSPARFHSTSSSSTSRPGTIRPGTSSPSRASPKLATKPYQPATLPDGTLLTKREDGKLFARRRGVVQLFDAVAGFGFVVDDESGERFYVHASALQGPAARVPLVRGQHV